MPRESSTLLPLPALLPEPALPEVAPWPASFMDWPSPASLPLPPCGPTLPAPPSTLAAPASPTLPAPPLLSSVQEPSLQLAPGGHSTSLQVLGTQYFLVSKAWQ